jgi:hypothetical protein
MHSTSKALLVDYHYQYGAPIRTGQRGLNQQLLVQLDALLLDLGMHPQKNHPKLGNHTSMRLSFVALRDELTLFAGEEDEQLKLRFANQRDSAGTALAIKYEASAHRYVQALDADVAPQSGEHPSHYVDVDAVVWGIIEAHKKLRAGSAGVPAVAFPQRRYGS